MCVFEGEEISGKFYVLEGKGVFAVHVSAIVVLGQDIRKARQNKNVIELEGIRFRIWWDTFNKGGYVDVKGEIIIK
jgi:hypothetical protein